MVARPQKSLVLLEVPEDARGRRRIPCAVRTPDRSWFRAEGGRGLAASARGALEIAARQIHGGTRVVAGCLIATGHRSPSAERLLTADVPAS